MPAQEGAAVLTKGCATMKLGKWEKKERQAQAKYTINST